MAENSGFEFELSENEIRNQFNAAFQKERFAIKTLLSLVNVASDDFEGQRKLTQAIYDTSEFDRVFRMASNDDFRLVSQNPRVPLPEKED